MSNEEDIIPKIQASEDDIAVRQKHIKQRRSTASTTHDKSSADLLLSGKPLSGKPAQAAPKQTIAICALLLSLLLAGLAGYLFLQLQQATLQIQMSEILLKEHAANLSSLNDQLSVTDENANLSVNALKVLLKENSKEIRKLWDLSNKANKPDIARNKKELTALNTSLAEIEESVNNLSATLTDKLKNTDNNVAKAVESIKNIDIASAENNTKILSLTSQIELNKQTIVSNKESIMKSVQEIVEKSNQSSTQALEAKILSTEGALNKQIKTLQTSTNKIPQSVERRISENEQAIRSIDANRKKLNGSMAAAETQINELKLKVEGL